MSDSNLNIARDTVGSRERWNPFCSSYSWNCYRAPQWLPLTLQLKKKHLAEINKKKKTCSRQRGRWKKEEFIFVGFTRKPCTKRMVGKEVRICKRLLLVVTWGNRSCAERSTARHLYPKNCWSEMTHDSLNKFIILLGDVTRKNTTIWYDKKKTTHKPTSSKREGKRREGIRYYI